jgi:hypothetical protein
MMTRSRRIVISGLLGLALAWIGSPARADQVWTVSVDTSQMTADYTGPFGIDFELLNGGSNSNTVTLSNFTFGGGGAVPPAVPSVGASGDLGSVVSLNDTGQFLVDFNQGFTPGTTLTFTMDSTLNGPPMGGIPDNFSMVLASSYDPINGYTPIPTMDMVSGTFFNFNINGPGTPPVSVYSSLTGDITLTVTPQGGAVPEPTSVITLFLGATGVLAAARWRRRAARRRSQAPGRKSATHGAS